MIGGHIIENIEHTLDDGRTVRRLWVMDTNGDECCVYAEARTSELACGEQIWWQGGTIYALDDRLTFAKIGYSFGVRSLVAA